MCAHEIGVQRKFLSVTEKALVVVALAGNGTESYRKELSIWSGIGADWVVLDNCH